MSTIGIKPLAVFANASVLDPLIGPNNESYRRMIATMEKTHHVVEVTIAGSLSETLNRVRDQNGGRKIEYAVIQAHGNPLGMQITEQKNYWWAGSRDFDAVAEDGRIFLWSCMTAAGKSFSIANRIHKATGRDVYAPRDLCGACEILTDKAGKYVPRFTRDTQAKDITCSFSKQRKEEAPQLTKFDIEAYKAACVEKGLDNVPAEEHYLAALESRGEEAQEYLFRAAILDHPRACYELAGIFERGQDKKSGYKPDLSRAIEYYTLAAQQGHDASIHKLAELCIEGRVDNPQEIYPWLGKLLCEKAHEKAPTATAYLTYFIAKGWYHLNGDPKMLKVALEARLESSIKAGNRAAHYVAGLLHLEGDWLTLSPKLAVYHLEKVQSSYPLALHYLAYLYERGMGVKQSHKKAFDLYARALEQAAYTKDENLTRSSERRRSLFAAELLLTKGRSAKKSEKAELEKYASLIKAEFLSAETLFKLAGYYEATNPEACLYYVKAAAKAGHSTAQHDLAAYYQGQGNIFFETGKKQNQKLEDRLKSLKQALQAYAEALVLGLTSVAKDIDLVRKYMFGLINPAQA